MDLQGVLALAVEICRLEREREMKRLMEQSLQEKVWEHSVLKRMKKEILAKEKAREKLVDRFMAFIEAIENNDLQNAQNFDEKAMMNDILDTMKSDCSKNGGFAGDRNAFGIYLGLEEKATKDAVETLVNNIANRGGDNGGFAGDRNALGIDLGLEEKARRDATEAPVISIANFGGDNGVLAGACCHERINNGAESANNLGEEGLRTPTKGTNSDGGEGSNAGGHDGSNRRN
ncbi:hypothetical protein DITRI_Ditri20bG0052300 [Diplodiscus trichospermus]